MIDEFSISSECTDYMTNKEDALKKIHNCLIKFDRQYSEKNKRTVVLDEYEKGLTQEVSRVLRVTDPALSTLVEAKVWWEYGSVDPKVYLQMSVDYRLLITTNSNVLVTLH